MPITPGCHPVWVSGSHSPASTMAGPIFPCCFSSSSASSKICRLNSCRATFSLFRFSAMASAAASSLVISSSTACCACSSLPDAFSRGASTNPIFSVVTASWSQWHTSSSLRKPVRVVVSMAFMPSFTRTLFSSCKGTMSATVPRAANSVSCSHSGPSGVFSFSRAWQSLKATPTPDNPLKG